MNTERGRFESYTKTNVCSNRAASQDNILKNLGKLRDRPWGFVRLLAGLLFAPVYLAQPALGVRLQPLRGGDRYPRLGEFPLRLWVGQGLL